MFLYLRISRVEQRLARRTFPKGTLGKFMLLVVAKRSRLQDVPVAQGPLQGWLHLHLLKLADGEVQML